MATKREVDVLADKVSSGLQLDPGGQLLDIEELVYKASPAELEALRKQVLQKQTLSGFDDEGLVKRFVHATKPKGPENGAGDNQSYFNCFQNQIMLPTVVDHCDQMPEDLQKNWLAVVCPQGTRVLVIACHKSTRVYDLEGTWICEHDTHLPGGSPNEISKVEDEECTILDCLYNDEQEIYYVVDLLCWKGLRFYKYETSVRMTTVTDKLKDMPSLKRVSQTNPFRFYSLPMSSGCQKNAICNAIARASFEMTGLLFYHKRALYLPGLSPLGVWVETSYIPSILDIQVHKLEYNSETSLTKRDWKKNRYEMSPEQCASIHNSAYVTNTQKNKPRRGGYNNYGQRGGQFQPFPNYPFSPPFPAIPNYSMGGYGGYGGYAGYGGYGGFNSHYQQQQQQRHYPRPQQNYHHVPKDSRKANEKQREKVQQEKVKKGMVNMPVKRIMLSVPVPDDRPNWPEWERHEVMMSVSMELIPENFEREYLAVICPVAKRRIVVSYFGWTCSYNKLLNMDRKFQSALPGGNVRSVQVIKSNDMCILDCLHLKAERTFYILDLMHWKQLPYYQSEAEFRFHWINQVENEMDLTTIHPENEYKFRSMPRIPCTQERLYESLKNATFKVDGILFFHMGSTYIPGTSPNVLWLPPGDIERILGWKPPDSVLPVPKKVLGRPPTATATSCSTEAASTSTSTDTTASSTASEATEKATGNSTTEVAGEKAGEKAPAAAGGAS